MKKISLVIFLVSTALLFFACSAKRVSINKTNDSSTIERIFPGTLYTYWYAESEDTDLTDELKSFLTVLAKDMKEKPNYWLVITGHSDNTGMDKAENTARSEARALRVAEFLIAKGVKEDKMNIEFKGDNEPYADKHSERGRMLNRRVDIKVNT